MFCDACGQPHRQHARFCAACGAELEAALPERVTSSTTHQRLAYAAALLQAADWHAGLAELEVLRRECEWSPVVEAYVGGALLGLGRFAEAKETLDAAHERAPDNFYVGLKRGELYCRMGIYPTAVEALDRALRSSAGDSAGRDAARTLLQFAREKNRGGFVRLLTRGKG
jgi:predicted Zn-dependent protease